MGFFDTPQTDNKWLVYYSKWLKVQASAYWGLPFLAYWIKFGLAWHDAGTPGTLDNVRFSAYWNMILIIYWSLGFYIFNASFDPESFKPLLSYGAWGTNFAHGVVAFIAVFTSQDYTTVLAENNDLGALGPNWDKLFVAVPTWFALFSINIFFCKKAFNSYLFPWDPASFAKNAAGGAIKPAVPAAVDGASA